MSSRYKQHSKREGAKPATLDIENESDPNYTPDYYMGASGYIQDSG